jgi:hypothetical protein
MNFAFTISFSFFMLLFFIVFVIYLLHFLGFHKLLIATSMFLWLWTFVEIFCVCHILLSIFIRTLLVSVLLFAPAGFVSVVFSGESFVGDRAVT